MSDCPVAISDQIDSYVASQGFRNADALLGVICICLLFWVVVVSLVVEFL